MDRNRWILVGAVILVLGLAGYVVAEAWFLPEASTRVDRPLDEMEGDDMQDGATGGMAPEALANATFRDGDALHHVSGTVTLYHGADGDFLRFEDYEATDGPDVYFYVVKGATDTVDGDDVKVLVPEGTDGHATLRGNFNVPLPPGMDWSAYDGVVVWCDRFDVEFGSAAFDAA